MKKKLKEILAPFYTWVLPIVSVAVTLYGFLLSRPGKLAVEWKPNEVLSLKEHFSKPFLIVDLCENETFSIEEVLPRLYNSTNKTINSLNVEYAFYTDNALPLQGRDYSSYDVAIEQVDGVNKTVFRYRSKSLEPFGKIRPPQIPELSAMEKSSIAVELKAIYEGIHKPLQYWLGLTPVPLTGLNLKESADSSKRSPTEILAYLETSLFKIAQKNSEPEAPLYVKVTSHANQSYFYGTKIRPNRIHRFAEDRFFKFNYFSFRPFFERGFGGYLGLLLALFWFVSTLLCVFVYAGEIIEDIKFNKGWGKWNWVWLLFSAMMVLLVLYACGYQDVASWKLVP